MQRREYERYRGGSVRDTVPLCEGYRGGRPVPLWRPGCVPACPSFLPSLYFSFCLSICLSVSISVPISLYVALSI